MEYTFNTKGVCSSKIEFEIDDGKVRNLRFTAGCSGNLKAVAAMAEGGDAKTLISKLKGIECGSKGTSCADQLAKALEKAL